MAKPAIQLLPYQQRWCNDKSRFKIANKARQIGYSFGSTYEVVEDCLARRCKWYSLSPGERQAKEALETAATHAMAFKAAVKLISEDLHFEGERFSALTLELPNGSKVSGLPANPRTARGSSGNLVLDEFAHHQDPRGIWRAIAPLITRGFRVLVLSTPNGKQGKFYELWTHGGATWSRHQVDIYQAVAEGLAVDIDELREFVGNDDDWAQEYECKFLDEAHAWIPYDLIDASESDEASIVLPSDFRPTGPCFFGFDVGRKRDLSVQIVLEKVMDLMVMRQLLVMPKTRFREQLEAADAVMPYGSRGAVDATGMGGPIAEDLQERWGESRIEAVTFNNSIKEQMASKLRKLYEDKRIRNPRDPELRADIHSIRRMVTAAGNFRFDAERSDNGHADRFWAQALAVLAGSDGAFVVPRVDVIERRGMNFFGAGGGERRWTDRAPVDLGDDADDRWRHEGWS